MFDHHLMISEERSDEVGGKKSHIVTYCLHPKTFPFCNAHLERALFQQPCLTAKNEHPLCRVKAARRAPEGLP